MDTFTVASFGNKRSGDPALATVISGGVFFGACTLMGFLALQKALEEDNIFWLTISGIGLVTGVFMTVLSLVAVRKVLKSRR